MQRRHRPPLACGRQGDALAEPVRRNAAERHGEDPEQRELGTEEHGRGAQSGELREIEYGPAELQRRRAHAFQVVVRRHHEVALRVSIEEGDRQPHELAEHVLHPAVLDVGRQAQRQGVGCEHAQSPQQPHEED